MPEKYEKVENLRFSGNPKEFSFFVITCSNGILFGQWVRIFLNFNFANFIKNSLSKKKYLI
jgi:hypothetical protein